MVLQAEGSQSELAAIEEVVYGTTPVGAGQNWTGLRMNRESLGLDVNLFESQEIRSDRQIAAILRGNRRADGDVTVEFGPQSHNLHLRHVLGGDFQTTGPVSDFYTHTIFGESSLPAGGLSIVKAHQDIPLYRTYNGGRIDSFAWEIPQEGIVTATIRYLCLGESPGSSTPIYQGSTVVFPTGDPYESNITEIYEASAVSAGSDPDFSSATPIGIVTGGRFQIGNNLDGNSYVLNSYERYSIPAGRRRIEGSFNFLFVDDTYYTKFLNGTPVALRVVMNTVDPYTDGYYHEFTFPRVLYAGGSPTPRIEGEQGVRYDLPWRAIRHVGASRTYDVKVVIRNQEQVVVTT